MDFSANLCICKYICNDRYTNMLLLQTFILAPVSFIKMQNALFALSGLNCTPSYFGTLMAPHWHQYPKNQRCTAWPFAHRCHDLATTSPWSYKSLSWSWTLNIIALAASFHFLQTSLFQNATFAFQRASVQHQLISPLPFWLHWWHIRGGANE